MIGTITRADKTGQAASAPVFVDRISFAGDAAYPTGGTAGFKALLNAVTKDSRTPLAVIGQDCGNNVVSYDETADKLKVRVGSTGAEVANAFDLSGQTFVVIVISQ